MADVRGGTAAVGALYVELSYRSVRKFKDGLGINMTMKKFFIFVPVQTITINFYSSEASFFFLPVQQYKHHVRSIARSGVCPQRRPHAQQQLARDLEVERAVMFSMFSMLLLLLAAAAAVVVRCRGPTLWSDEWGTHPG